MRLKPWNDGLMITANKAIERAKALPNGARFYRCALQINPFEYLARHNKTTAFKTETAYNAAIIEACIGQGVEVIGVTDHYRIRSAQALISRAREAGLIVFPGFEAVTKEGVHFLCFLEPTASLDLVQAKISDCGIHNETDISPLGKYDVGEFLAECDRWSAVCIAAHVAADGGLLKVLKNRPRIAAWTNRKLVACSLPGPASEAPAELLQILENKDPQYRRTYPIAILNAQDVTDPSDLKKPGSSCWIKMSEVSIQGLRQAFLDPSSRVRLSSDPALDQHSELIAIAWEAGFLDGTAIHFNPNLNVLIGGRGAGKSTVIESLRYLLQLEPNGEESRKNYQGIVSQVLKSGTKISLLVRSYTPNQRDYLIERTIPNPPVVRDDSGQVLALTPKDVLTHVEVFGQHEISELARDPAKRTRLLDRFMASDSGSEKRRSEAKRNLDRSRRRINDLENETKQIQERLATLPVVEETLKRYQDAGLEQRLKEQSLLVKEERVFKTATERLAPFKEMLDQLRHSLPIDRAFLSERALQDLPAKNIIRGLDSILLDLETTLSTLGNQIEAALTQTETKFADARKQWNVRKEQVDGAYQKILRDLQKSKIDADEFLRLRRQLEDLRPLKERLDVIKREMEVALQDRRNLLAEWEDLQRQDFERLSRAAKKVNRQLTNRVSVDVSYDGNREPLLSLLKEKIGDRLSETLEALKRKPDLSLSDFVNTIRSGKDELAQKYSLPPSQADRLVQSGESTVMFIEELELPPITQIRLNISTDEQSANWKTLDELSTGQKATAILLLLLLESDAPLIVDQPEDDLDNRFISEGVVPKMREEKRRRQFLFATHNANIPVLGDAELIVGLTPAGEATEGSAEIKPEHIGSIDSRTVRELVEELLEGGKDAFEMRRLKYGF